MAVVDEWVSPLVEVERAVQERAKAISLDLSAAGGAERLRSLIDDEVARWSDDLKRGLRDFDLADPATVADRAFRNLAGYGPLEPLLADEDVWEIMINGPEAILSQSASIPDRLRGRPSSGRPPGAQPDCSARSPNSARPNHPPEAAYEGHSARPGAGIV